MTTAAFPEAYAFVLGLELGWHAGSHADPNPTLDGVTQHTYDAWRDDRSLPRRSVREMEESERFAIYEEFWQRSHAESLPAAAPRSRLVHFAYFFNTRPLAAYQALQRALRVTPDGVIGPLTRAAMADSTDEVLLPRLLVEQMVAYYDLARNPRLRPNLTSWIGRLVAAWRNP